MFRKNGDSANINELSIHLSQGNFSVLQDLAEKPHDIANFLKQILRELAEPICPFNLYPKFRDMIITDSREDKLNELAEYLMLMPLLNRNTLLFIVRFFRKVAVYEDKNKMTAYNLAVVITPNVFRSKELSI